ncbi:hypothetical protein DICSQDRAFT_175107 [Dichomitus squalens LYAD-421 SS1]|uniref:Glucose-methanol-choline oxidoreductase N-terminal domain-containing protein n=1 Tax=Dichomitus squalens (strain LYAD-421) TaxID=732165 RepID=R7SK54_DICSQ|nr:uncharacterized protein DICSQDRAFT_175107 [Dichomitus squalens LYAD-421 SS1]EJF56208.1 hypothetical protein DICSQDRAFT_175107 [Dichomitus squalens LYAD-421 SS1]
MTLRRSMIDSEVRYVPWFQWTVDSTCGTDIQPTGTFKATANIDPKTGARSTAATDYIVPALDPPNLKVFTTAYVNRILTKQDGDDVIATGVEFEYGGDVHVVHAANRVILCGCTSKSPHIVGLNGIGNCNVLEDLGIPVHLLYLQQFSFQVNPENSAETKVEHGFVTSETITSPEVQTELRSIYIEAAGPLSLACTGVAFLSLHTITERADELIEKVEKRIKRTTDKLSPGSKEQYELHLKLLNDKKVLDLEIVVFPVNVHPAGAPKPHIGLLPSIARVTLRSSQRSSRTTSRETLTPRSILLGPAKFICKVMQDGPWKEVSEADLIPRVNITTDEQLRELAKTNVSTTWRVNLLHLTVHI